MKAEKTKNNRLHIVGER